MQGARHASAHRGSRATRSSQRARHDALEAAAPITGIGAERRAHGRSARAPRRGRRGGATASTARTKSWARGLGARRAAAPRGPPARARRRTRARLRGGSSPSGFSDGPADEPALPAGDADVLHHAEIVGVLDALGDHQRAAVLGDVLDRAQELQLHRVVRDAGDEMLVGLHVLGLQLRPEPQAREALAQVVDGDAESHRAVQHQRLVHEAEVERRIVLGELDHHARRARARATCRKRSTRCWLEAALQDDLRRDVEEEAARDPRSAKRAQDLLDAEEVQLDARRRPACAAAKSSPGVWISEPSGPRTSAS